MKPAPRFERNTNCVVPPVPSGTRGLDRFPSRSRIPLWLTPRASGSRAPVSLRSRASRCARGRAVLIPVSVDRTRGNDAGAVRATFPRGWIKEGTAICPAISTACS